MQLTRDLFAVAKLLLLLRGRFFVLYVAPIKVKFGREERLRDENNVCSCGNGYCSASDYALLLFLVFSQT